MINFNSNKLVIVCYPEYAGGKFLINSLGLSDSAVFQDQNLASKQLNGQFMHDDKLNFLKNEINKVDNEWNDLNLGCYQLFGFENSSYLIKYDDLVNSLMFNKIISRLTVKNSHYFFIVAHNFKYLNAYLKFWPNAQIIFIKNYKEFVDYRSQNNHHWNMYRGVDWPSNPPLDQTEFNNYPNKIREELINSQWFVDSYLKRIMSDAAHYRLYYELLNKLENKVIEWDAGWFWSKENTITQIGKIYKELKLNDFNSDSIEIYYNLWIQKIEKINNTKRNK